MPGSNLLLLYEVREAAGEVLGQLIDPHNVLHIKSLASTFSCREVESKARNFLLERFELVSTTPEFLKLGPRELGTYLAMDDIIVRSEESIFDCILRWIEVDSEQRTRHFDSLVTHVRFALISQHHLDTSIKPRGLVQRSAVCAQLIKEAETLRANQRCGDGAAAALGAGAVPQYRGSNQLLFLQSANLSPWLKNPPVLFDFKKTKWKAVKGPSGVCRYRELYCTVLYCTYCTAGTARAAATCSTRAPSTASAGSTSLTARRPPDRPASNPSQPRGARTGTLRWTTRCTPSPWRTSPGRSTHT